MKKLLTNKSYIYVFVFTISCFVLCDSSGSCLLSATLPDSNICIQTIQKLDKNYIIVPNIINDSSTIIVFNKPIIKGHLVEHFQLGKLAFFTMKRFGPMALNFHSFSYINGCDTMIIECAPVYGHNIYIDSLQFKKGRFFAELNFPKDIYSNDTITTFEGKQYLDAVNNNIEIDSLVFYFYKFRDKFERSFQEYYLNNIRDEFLLNEVWYCQVKNKGRIKKKSAKYFVQDVLRERYLPMEVVKLTRIDSVEGIYMPKKLD